MTTTISIINLKGGVGKTTVAVALCDFLRSAHGKRVLLIDLDPQMHATMAFIHEGRWRVKNEAGETIAQLVRDGLANTARFDIEAAIERNVSCGIALDHEGQGQLDVLASSNDLIELQDYLPQVAMQPFYAVNPVDVLRHAIDRVKDQYDFIVLDCPSNLGALALNGLRISDFYLMPVIPDHLSTHAIPDTLNKVRRFQCRMAHCDVEPLGIIINRNLRSDVQLELDIIRSIRNQSGYPDVLRTELPHTVDAVRIFDPLIQPRTLNQKYASTFSRVCWELTNEVIFKLHQRWSERGEHSQVGLRGKWHYITRFNRSFGPLAADDIVRYVEPEEFFVWKPGMPGWQESSANTEFQGDVTIRHPDSLSAMPDRDSFSPSSNGNGSLPSHETPFRIPGADMGDEEPFQVRRESSGGS